MTYRIANQHMFLLTFLKKFTVLEIHCMKVQKLFPAFQIPLNTGKKEEKGHCNRRQDQSQDKVYIRIV